MKRVLVFVFVISLAIAALLMPAKGRATQRICRPTEEELQACEAAGGIFDYGLCKCRIF
jgi:hypothetical protein